MTFERDLSPFIISNQLSKGDEQFGKLNITKKGNLDIIFRNWYIKGTRSQTTHHVFCFKDDKFRLIRYQKYTINRGSGDTERYTIDFREGTATLKTDNIFYDSNESTKKSKFRTRKLKTLESIREPFTW